MSIHINDLRKTEQILFANIFIPVCRLLLEESVSLLTLNPPALKYRLLRLRTPGF